LETLQFILKAKRYWKTYSLLQQSFPDSASRNVWRTHMMVQWQHLMTTHITPSAPREINISPAIHAELLDFANVLSPPSPDLLEAPVQSMHYLINASILEPFCKECSRKRRMISLSTPLLVSAWSISPTENFDGCMTKRWPPDSKSGKDSE
jgi:hypothetical protein